MHVNMRVNFGKFIGEISSILDGMSQTHIDDLKRGCTFAVDTEFSSGGLISECEIVFIVKAMQKLERDKRLLVRYDSFEQVMAEWEFSGISDGTATVFMTFLEHSGLFPGVFRTLSYFNRVGNVEKFRLSDICSDEAIDRHFFKWR